MNILQVESELKKRWSYPYRWGRVQDNDFDQKTRFIYNITSFTALLAEIERRFHAHPAYKDLFNYALNRWYNFRSAKAIEEIFAASEGVIPAKNQRDRLVDFSINNVQFDHKTSVFPRGFGRNLTYARQHPQELIQWLYKNQSQGQRKHLKNRLFIVLHAADGRHWKLKAEITWLKILIKDYVKNFDPAKLYRLHLESQATLADVIWATE